MAKCVDACWFN